MKDVFATKFRLTFIKSYLNINVDFAVFHAQHCLVSMIKKWKESVDNGGAFGAPIKPLQITCTQTALHVHENSCMVLRTKLRTTYCPPTQTVML